MTLQAKWFSFGAFAGLPAALLTLQMHWVASFDVAVAVAVVKAQWCYRSTVVEVNALKASLPATPNLQKISATRARLAELNQRLDECARDDPRQNYK